MTSPRNTGQHPANNRWPPLAVCFILAWGVLCTPLQAYAQSARLTGRVVSTDGGTPLANVHVFIANSMVGTTTDAEGHFELPEVPPGAHHFVVSMIGYAPYEQDSLFRADQSYSFNIALEPATVELAEIVVSAREARRWQRRLVKFTRLFIGETRNSELTTIVNPEVLSFTSRLGNLTATASAPLVIENRALGYRMQYFLKEFYYSGNTIKYDGDPLFTELDPDGPEEANTWDINRQIAFLGSKRHYFLSLLQQRTTEEGFITYRRYRLDSSSPAFLVDTESLLREGPTPLEKELTFTGYLEIVFTAAKEDEYFRRWQRMDSSWRLGEQRSFIKLNDGPTLVDETGEVIDPYGITEYGYFAFERMGDLIPKEYRPPGWDDYSPDR